MRSTPWLIKVYRQWSKSVEVHSFLTRRFIAKAANIHSSKTGICLDVGAGTAPYRQEISKHFAVRHYFAVDFTYRGSLDVIADARVLPIRDQSIDLVVCFEVLQHIAEYYAVLDEIRRVLRPEGLFIVSFPFIYGECGVVDFRRWTVAGMTQELESRGLVPVSSAQQGGALYVITNMLIWVIQYLVPGSRAAWRSPRTSAAYCREGLTAFLTFPLVLLSWLAIAVDGLLPVSGCYMGAVMFAHLASSQTEANQGLPGYRTDLRSPS
jgi:SAM-dependent methyltransferase